MNIRARWISLRIPWNRWILEVGPSLFPPNNFRIYSLAIHECNLSPRAYYPLENVNRFHLWTLYANFTFFKLRAEVRSLVNSPLRNPRVFNAAILQLFGQRCIRAFSADRPSIRASLLPCVVNYRAISTAPPMRPANYRRSAASTNIHRSWTLTSARPLERFTARA